MNKKKRILLTDVSSYKAITIATFIKKFYKNVEIFTCDTRFLTQFVHTRFTDKHFFISHNLRDPINYCNQIATIIKDNAIDILIPTNSSEIRLMLQKRALFKNTLNYIGTLNSFEILDQKNQLNHFCVTKGISVPKIFDKASEATFPCVVKPTNKSASEGVKYFFNQEELVTYLKDKDVSNLMIQEYITGIGCGYSIFAEKGKILIENGHLRLAEHPVTGGSSVYRESIILPEMKECVEKIINPLAWSGFVMFEFKLTREGKLFLIEANPRVWGSINQGLASGVNYLKPLLGAPDILPPENPKIKTYLSPLIYKSFLGYIFKGKIKPLLIFLRNICSNKADVSLIKDPLGFFSLLLRI